MNKFESFMKIFKKKDPTPEEMTKEIIISFEQLFVVIRKSISGYSFLRAKEVLGEVSSSWQKISDRQGKSADLSDKDIESISSSIYCLVGQLSQERFEFQALDSEYKELIQNLTDKITDKYPGLL